MQLPPTLFPLQIPPCPPKPDFSQSHGKLAMLQAGDSSLTPEEIEKLKQEIQRLVYPILPPYFFFPQPLTHTHI